MWLFAVAGIGELGRDAALRRPDIAARCPYQIRLSPIHESTARPIVRSLAGNVYVLTVTLSPPVTLSDAEKLDALRRLDQFRQWRSLDEKRYCLVCGKIITGRQIQVAGGTHGPLRLSCPTERCNSIPMDWVLPTDEIIAKVERMVAEEREAAIPIPVSRVNGGHERSDSGPTGIASRLRQFAFHFRRRS
jgi:hypothetical protein